MKIVMTCMISFCIWGTTQAIHTAVTRSPAFIPFTNVHTMQSSQSGFISIPPNIVTEYNPSIRSGMTRNEVGQIYPIDGGLQSGVNVRYLVPDLPNTKVLVTFDVKRNPNDQNRIQTTDEDKVISVSPAYHKTPFCD